MARLACASQARTSEASREMQRRSRGGRWQRRMPAGTEAYPQAASRRPDQTACGVAIKAHIRAL